MPESPGDRPDLSAQQFRSKARPVLWGFVTGLTVLAAGGNLVVADEALLPEDAVLLVHLDPLEALYDAPIIAEIWDRLQSSRQLQQGLQTVEAQQFREAVAFLEQRLARPWSQIAADLTAGGVDLAVLFEGEPQLLIVAHAADEELASELIDVAVELAGAGQAGGESPVAIGEHRGVTGYRLGNAVVAHVESRLLLATHPELLKATVDRLLDQPVSAAVRSEQGGFGASVRLNLTALRSLPNVAEGLQVPAENGGLIAFLGGWIDLLRRHEQVTLKIQLGDGQIDAVVRFDGADDPSPRAFDGYWADTADEHSAPVLQVPGVIYSASWYRDYGALWNARAQLVTAKVVKQMERADAEAAAQFEALGSAVPLSEVVQQLGPRLRVVVAQQPAPPYEFELRNQLPAAALVIELDDEDAFRTISSPLARVVHLILSFEQKITSERLDYAGAQLQQLSFPHTDKDVARRDQTQYNVRPTHCVTRGHFIIGTTPDIVRQTIDAIDAQAGANSGRDESGITSEQLVDISQFAAALDRMRDTIVRRSVLEGGLDIDTADHEFDVLLSVLRLFDKKSLAGVFTDDGFEHRVTVTTKDLRHPDSAAPHTTTRAD